MKETTQTTRECIGGYSLITDWKTSGTAQWAYAEKNGQQWFIKRFLAPKYKIAGEGITEKMVEKAKKRCEVFHEKQTAYYNQIQKADTGNIVYITDFFSFETSFYAVSPRIEIANISITEVSNLSYEKKIVLLKVLTYSLKNLHAQGVVHADLKPSNIILKKTASGNYTLKLIDFDAGFLEKEPRRGESVIFDPVYVAPETIVALGDVSVNLTSKIDIYALGLLIHQYFTGELPKLPEGYLYAADAMLNGEKATLSKSLPLWLAELVSLMLRPDPEERPDISTVFQWIQDQKKPEKPKSSSPWFRIPRL